MFNFTTNPPNQMGTTDTDMRGGPPGNN